MKAQSATEFFLYITLFMFVALIAFLVVNYTQNSEMPVQKNKVAVEVGYNFADAVALAVRGGEGFIYTYYFPKTVYGYPYNMTFKQNSLLMEWTNEYGSFNYHYSLPNYNYKYVPCPSEPSGTLQSDKCSNVLILENDGSSLTIKRG